MAFELILAVCAGLFPVLCVFAAFFFVGFVIFLFLTLYTRGESPDLLTDAERKTYTDYRRAAIICACGTAFFALCIIGILVLAHIYQSV